MKVVTTREQLRAARAGLGSVGLVPTMGYLHEGHLSLVRAARRAHDAVVVSIFVNPTQFGPGEDLERYPRDLDRDLALLADAGVDLVWTPAVEDVYPAGPTTTVHVAGVADVLEGASRPGHFDGVATVCTILFGAVQPQRAYFGQKDAQQTVVVRQVVRDLALPLEIVVEPIARDADGLALSSRNVYLTAQQRAAAPALHRALRSADAAHRAGEDDAARLRALVTDAVAAEPLMDLEYVSVAHPQTLRELDVVTDGALVSLAARLGPTRLIDNVVLGPRNAVDRAGLPSAD